MRTQKIAHDIFYVSSFVLFHFIDIKYIRHNTIVELIKLRCIEKEHERFELSKFLRKKLFPRTKSGYVQFI